MDEWEELDPQTLEFDDLLGIVRNEDMQIIAFPSHLSENGTLVLDGDHFALRTDVEVLESWNNYGGVNHNNYNEGV